MSAILLQNLPQEVLENILGSLSFTSVWKLSRECCALRSAAYPVLRRGLRQLLETSAHHLRGSYDAAQTLKGLAALGADCGQYEGLAVSVCVLRIIFCELLLLGVYVLRKDSPLPPGDILDEVECVLDLVHTGDLGKELKPEITSNVFMKCDNFFDFIERIGLLDIDTRNSSCRRLIDILACCTHCCRQYMLMLSSSSPGFFLKAYYEIRDMSIVDPPPDIRKCDTNKALEAIMKYLRIAIHWQNLIQPLKDLWDYQDLLERRRDSVLRHGFLFERHFERASFNHHWAYGQTAKSSDERDADEGKRGCGRTGTDESVIWRKLSHTVHAVNSRVGIACHLRLWARSEDMLPQDCVGQLNTEEGVISQEGGPTSDDLHEFQQLMNCDDQEFELRGHLTIQYPAPANKDLPNPETTITFHVTSNNTTIELKGHRPWNMARMIKPIKQ